MEAKLTTSLTIFRQGQESTRFNFSHCPTRLLPLSNQQNQKYDIELRQIDIF